MWRKGSPSALLVEMQIGTAAVESTIVLPQKIKNGTVLCARDFISGNLSEENKNINSKEYKHPYVHCSLFTIVKVWKQPRCPSVDERIK